MALVDRTREELAKLDDICSAGFAVALHVRFTTPTFLFQRYRKAWMDHYSSNGLVMQDPTVKWGFENDGMIDWSDLGDSDPSGVLVAAKEHGLKFGFTLSTSDGGTKSFGSFSHGDRAFTADEVATVTQLFRDMHAETREPSVSDDEVSQALKDLSVELTHR
jgi:LuxR family transcriptional regulator